VEFYSIANINFLINYSKKITFSDSEKKYNFEDAIWGSLLRCGGGDSAQPPVTLKLQHSTFRIQYLPHLQPAK